MGKVDELFEEFLSYKEKQKNEIRRKADFDLACNTFNMAFVQLKIDIDTIIEKMPQLEKKNVKE